MWWLILGIFIGFVLGACGQDRRWRKNADVSYRIYSWRRLYKVSYADKGKEWGGGNMSDFTLINMPAIARAVHTIAGAVHKNAVRKGFWDSAVRGVGVYAEEFIPEKLALIHSEVSEALEKYRDNPGIRVADIDGFGEELADIVIRTMDLAEAYGIDIYGEVAAKHVKNLEREHMHGGKRC